MSKTPIFSDVTLHIAKGEWISLIGPSGSGKTSLLNIIGGSIELSSGKVFIEQTDIQTLSINEKQLYVREKISTVYQQFRLLPQFTVLENIMLPLIPYRDRKVIQAKALELMEDVGLEEHAKKLPSQLSGGQQQRVAFARALITEPDILLCDEPTGNLDHDNRNNILELLSVVHKKGKTIVLATHDDFVTKKSDRIITFTGNTIHIGGDKIASL